MKRRFVLLAAGVALVCGLGLTGCAKQAEQDGKVDPKELSGTGDNSSMPPEARKAMEEAKAKGGPPKDLGAPK